MPRSASGDACLVTGILPVAMPDPWRIGADCKALVAFIFCFLLAVVGSARAAVSLSEGRAMAIGACSACHQVTPDQKRPPAPFDPVEAVNVAAPDFGIIAWKYANKPVALRRRILEQNHPMPEMDWDAQGLDNVIAYIRSARNIWRKPR